MGPHPWDMHKPGVAACPLAPKPEQVVSASYPQNQASRRRLSLRLQRIPITTISTSQPLAPLALAPHSMPPPGVLGEGGQIQG